MEPTLTIEEVAQFLKLSYRTIARLVEAGRLEAFKAGHATRFTRQALDAFCAQNTINPRRKTKQVPLTPDQEPVLTHV